MNAKKAVITTSILLCSFPSYGILSEDKSIEWKSYVATAYSHHCIVPRFGVESWRKFKGADGKWPIPDITVAMDRSVPFGTKVELSYMGFKSLRIVGDRGRSIKGNRIDLFMKTCREARQWGRRVIKLRMERIEKGISRTSNN